MAVSHFCAPTTPAASQSQGASGGGAPSDGCLHLALSPASQHPCPRSGCRRDPGRGPLLTQLCFQDRDFLENEQFFLETLKKASYNMTSHSA